MIPVYFHGLPGSPRELELVPGARQSIAPQRPEYADFATLAADIARHTQGARLHLIGFSLGVLHKWQCDNNANLSYRYTINLI